MTDLTYEQLEREITDPSTSSERLAFLVHEWRITRGLYEQITLHPNTSPETLDLLTLDPDSFVRASVASRPEALRITLDRLSHSTDIVVLFAILMNPGQGPSSEALRSLFLRSCLGSREVQELVACHRNAPKDVLDECIHSDIASIRRYAAINPRIPLTDLIELTNDPDAEVASTARSRMEIRTDLLKDEQ
jgi:hypothetical protein